MGLVVGSGVGALASYVGDSVGFKVDATVGYNVGEGVGLPG